LCVLENYGIQNELVVLENDIQKYQQRNDSLIKTLSYFLKNNPKYGTLDSLKKDVLPHIMQNKVLEIEKTNVRIESLICERDELLKDMELAIEKQNNETSIANNTAAINPSIDRLIKKDLPKRSFKKFKKAIIAII
jgi:hypothetical protein